MTNYRLEWKDYARGQIRIKTVEGVGMLGNWVHTILTDPDSPSKVEVSLEESD